MRNRPGTSPITARPTGPIKRSIPRVKLASIPGRWPAEPGIECLRNEYPTTIETGGDAYASAVHAYWALATTDEDIRTTIGRTTTALSVERTVGRAPLRHDWADLRLTAMHATLRT